MARLQTILVAALAQTTYVGAGVVQPLGPRRVAPFGGELISTRNFESVDDSALIISAPSEPMIMTPLRNVRRGNTKRDRRAALELREEETLYWTAQDGTMAELRIQMPGESENVVNLELIDDMVREVACPDVDAGRLKLRFAEEADFNDAADIWQWVNQQADNHFTLIIGAGACGWNDERILYNVGGLVYDEEKETAILDVQRTSWKEAAHTFDLVVGKAAAAGVEPSARARRGIFGKIGSAIKDKASDVVDTVSDAASTVADTASDVVDTVSDAAISVVDTASDVADTVVDNTADFVETAIEKAPEVADTVIDGVDRAAKAVVDTAGDTVDAVVDAVDSVANLDTSPDFSIPFNSDFSNKSLSFSKNGVEIGASCTQCFTTGAFDIRGRFRARQFQFEEAWVELSTEGISAKAVIGLTLKGDLTDTLLEKSLPIFKVSPAGVAIPGVLTIGPTVSVSLGAEISAIKGGVTVSCGGTAVIPPSTSRLDFLDEDRTTSDGWKPKFKAEPFKVDAFIEAKASAFLRAAVGLEISAVETGFAAEMSAKLPALSATLKAIQSATCTACGDHQNGLQGSLSLGTSIGVSLTKKVLGDEEPLWSLTFAEAKLPEIAGFCQGFGPRGAACLAK